MKKNRRNYYRILHVQPEAPSAVIKAAYRALMGPLRQHPDLGGEHEAAALINEAYAVLGDAGKRQAYDRTRGKAGLQGRGNGQGNPGTVPANASASSEQAPDPARWMIDRCCPLCRHPLAATLGAHARCARCEGPLTPAPQPAADGREVFGRRASSRLARNHPVVLVPGWKAAPLNAVMRDLSLTGVSLRLQVPIAASRAIRIVDPGFDAVALVVSCRRSANLYSLHARLLTVRFIRQAGVFISTTA
jgi:DnaJ domain